MTHNDPFRDPRWPEIVGAMLGVIVAALILFAAVAHVLGDRP